MMVASTVLSGLLVMVCYLFVWTFGCSCFLIYLLIGALPVEGLIISQDIVVWFPDWLWLPCAGSKWLKRVDLGLIFCIRSQFSPISFVHDVNHVGLLKRMNSSIIFFFLSFLKWNIPNELEFNSLTTHYKIPLLYLSYPISSLLLLGNIIVFFNVINCCKWFEWSFISNIDLFSKFGFVSTYLFYKIKQYTSVIPLNETKSVLDMLYEPCSIFEG